MVKRKYKTSARTRAIARSKYADKKNERWMGFTGEGFRKIRRGATGSILSRPHIE